MRRFLWGEMDLFQNYPPAGIDFVEENLLTTQEQVLDGLKDTDNAIRTGVTIDLEDGNNTSYKPSPEPDLSSENQFFRAKSNYRKVVDKDAKPCFGVDSLAECYAKQIEKIADSSVDAVPMIGIFGPWGRGKTYFYSRIKDYFSENIIRSLSLSSLMRGSTVRHQLYGLIFTKPSTGILLGGLSLDYG